MCGEDGVSERKQLPNGEDDGTWSNARSTRNDQGTGMLG